LSREICANNAERKQEDQQPYPSVTTAVQHHQNAPAEAEAFNTQITALK